MVIIPVCPGGLIANDLPAPFSFGPQIKRMGTIHGEAAASQERCLVRQEAGKVGGASVRNSLNLHAVCAIIIKNNEHRVKIMNDFFIGKTVVPIQGVKDHAHPLDEIILNISGTGRNIVGGREFDFYPGNILCIPAGREHRKEADERFEDIYIRVEKIPICREVVTFEDDEFKSIQKLMEILYYHYFRADKVFGAATAGLVNALVQLLQQHVPREKKNHHAEYLQCKIIQNFTDPEFSLEDAMAKLPYCVDYTRKLFFEAFGINPKEYVIRLRMEKACELLRDSNASIAGIALECGYYDASYFARLFKKYTGVSPAAYKR